MGQNDIRYSISINGQTSSSTMEKAKKYVGNRCLELQQKLNKFGYNLTEDGVYGIQTHKALGDFQRSQGLTVDYIAGDKTWQALSK
ncbi:MAG: peptidoglycan-binding domain-containing protein [Clostridium sp.]